MQLTKNKSLRKNGRILFEPHKYSKKYKEHSQKLIEALPLMA